MYTGEQEIMSWTLRNVTGEQGRTLGNHVGWTLTGEQDRTLGNHVGWTLMKCILGNKTGH